MPIAIDMQYIADTRPEFIASQETTVPALPTLIAFGLVSLGMVLTPGPNMIYLISRSICQGRRAGLVSLGGVALGFVFYMFCAAFGITALVMTVPYAHFLISP